MHFRFWCRMTTNCSRRVGNAVTSLVLAGDDVAVAARQIGAQRGIAMVLSWATLTRYSGSPATWTPTCFSSSRNRFRMRSRVPLTGSSLAAEIEGTTDERSILVGRNQRFEEYQTTIESGGFCYAWIM